MKIRLIYEFQEWSPKILKIIGKNIYTYFDFLVKYKNTIFKNLKFYYCSLNDFRILQLDLLLLVY